MRSRLAAPGFVLHRRSSYRLLRLRPWRFTHLELLLTRPLEVRSGPLSACRVRLAHASQRAAAGRAASGHAPRQASFVNGQGTYQTKNQGTSRDGRRDRSHRDCAAGRSRPRCDGECDGAARAARAQQADHADLRLRSGDAARKSHHGASARNRDSARHDRGAGASSTRSRCSMCSRPTSATKSKAPTS